MEYRFPEGTPWEVEDYLLDVFSKVHSILRDSLVGIYLHGSLAMACFQPNLSDIDCIFIVGRKLSGDERSRIIDVLRRFWSRERRIEVSVFVESVVLNPQCPIAVELRFDYPDNVFENEKDLEVLSHLYETSKRGFCIWGKKIGDVFSKVPAEYYLISIVEDVKSTGRFLEKDPVYWILNSCRALAFIREGKVFSKLEGGEWGLENLPTKYRHLIQEALYCYRGEKAKGDIIWNDKELKDYSSFMSELISSELEFGVSK